MLDSLICYGRSYEPFFHLQCHHLQPCAFKKKKSPSGHDSVKYFWHLESRIIQLNFNVCLIHKCKMQQWKCFSAWMFYFKGFGSRTLTQMFLMILKMKNPGLNTMQFLEWCGTMLSWKPKEPTKKKKWLNHGSESSRVTSFVSSFRMTKINLMI